ncbi:MAG: hypothetical protein KZQ94_22720 [Candidatus Thiodiazotropha sp. (ex Troendleina suluensis)]|nr:hypothetical protein [Candidatus Thiodiazotropha sp. (ex Troendleina suluensis)]MCU7842171.1 hypothetical protein [Candidatus Thiodiazotropha sp. (ex Troendleina suluensis)]
MRRRNWKNFRANSRREAVEACIRHAREMHNASVERVAEEAGLEGHWRIYKWMESGDVPLRLVIPFQKACGCTFITDYMAYATHKLVISMPTGRQADSRSIFKLQAHLNATVGYMLQYDEQHADQLAEKAINAIKTAMEDLAYHQINIEKQRQPELELFGEPS